MRASLRARAATACVLLVAAGVQAVAKAAEPDPWQGWADAEPLELAALVDRVGDDAVLARLAPGHPVAVRLAAVRATPFLRSPELSLLPLAELAGSRDPDLAPLAARRAFSIAQALAHEGLWRREILPSTLSSAKAALARAASQSQPRRDLRLRLEEAVELLGALGVP